MKIFIIVKYNLSPSCKKFFISLSTNYEFLEEINELNEVSTLWLHNEFFTTNELL